MPNTLQGEKFVKKPNRFYAARLAGFAAVCTLLAACSTSQARPQIKSSVAQDPDSRQPVSYYQAQLAELPLRMKFYDLAGVNRRDPVVVRQLHVIHDDVRDEILVIDHDNGPHMWSLDPANFTLHWRTPLEKRVAYDPMATRNYVVLMDTDGTYQAYDRLTGPREEYSRLVSKGRYEGDLFPSAEPAFNDTHIFVPATNSNSMRGVSLASSAAGLGAESWSYPAAGSASARRFEQIALKPAADRESIVFVNNNNLLYMIDAQTGEFRASPDLERDSRTPPVIHDDLVFVGTDRGQLFGFLKSGEAAFTIPTPGLPYGDIFVEDHWIFVHTLEVYDKEVPTDDGKGTRLRADTRPGLFCAYQYKYVDVPGDRPVLTVVDGDPSTPWVADPMWTEPDVGQRVLMKNGDQLYMLYEEKEEAFGTRELAKLKAEGRVVRKDEEFRTVSRTMKINDVKTGKLLRPDWVYNMADFAFVVGSAHERDRALYFATLDGYVFRCYAGGGSAGGR